VNATLLKWSFREVGRHGDAFVATFYEKLFGEHPEMIPLFPADMRRQRQKFLISLTAIIQSLEHHKDILPYLAQLGAKHHNCQAAPNQYAAFKQALFETMADYLGPEWTADVEQAWEEAYAMVTRAMLEKVPAG
jgi:hemoglobin-like flavoprotein